MADAAPGWYHADGDPPNTERYWDGSSWTDGPRPTGGLNPLPSPEPPVDSSMSGTNPDASSLGGSMGQPVPGAFPGTPVGGPVGTFAESSQADLALILSSVGALLLLIGFCCLPLALVGFGLAIGGVVIGQKEITGIDAGRRNPAKRGNANAARIVGGVVLVLAAIGFALAIIFAAVGNFG